MPNTYTKKSGEVSNYAQSASVQRRLLCHPNYRYFAMFEADRALKSIPGIEMNKSELLNDILETHYKSKGEKVMTELLAHYDKIIKANVQPKKALPSKRR